MFLPRCYFRFYHQTQRVEVGVRHTLEIGAHPDKGKAESATATLEQIQSLQYEMEDYGASLYAKKWAAEKAIADAVSAEDIEKITW